VKSHYAALVIASCITFLTGCTGSGGYPGARPSVSVGYHTGFYGAHPYGPYYRPPTVIVAPDPGGPIATPLPLDSLGGGMGMPDAGFNDFPDFDF